ncbi:aminotransferase class IV [Brevundimonas sp. VNH65]|uniref:aminotransferase class IV n=1 Tax=Brevundimonas sp. VNH65 TaxID=3400917 RepID=UPI003C040D0D
MQRLWIDGEPAVEADLIHQLLHPYGAFTSFRVEEGAVRGLDLHLSRLEASARDLFGEPVDARRLRTLIRQAAPDSGDAWLRVSLFSREIRMRNADFVGAPSVMVGVFDAPPPLAGELSLQAQVHERETPHLKHVATFGLMGARRQARAAGHDDALFADSSGLISEGSVWNIGFLKGDHVVWPQAPMLDGVAQALIRRHLASVDMSEARRPVRLDDLGGFDGAFICNSATPAAGVCAIDGVSWAVDPIRIARLQSAWAAEPPEKP